MFNYYMLLQVNGTVKCLVSITSSVITKLSVFDDKVLNNTIQALRSPHLAWHTIYLIELKLLSIASIDG